MYCLLCHAKISRWRRLKTSSEFCCEEHAEQYKQETVGRLLEYAAQTSNWLEDPIHRLSMIAGGEGSLGTADHDWQMQEFVTLTPRQQTTPRLPA